MLCLYVSMDVWMEQKKVKTSITKFRIIFNTVIVITVEHSSHEPNRTDHESSQQRCHSLRSINNVTELHMDHAFYGNSLSRENIRIHSTVTVYIAQKISIKNHS